MKVQFVCHHCYFLSATVPVRQLKHGSYQGACTTLFCSQFSSGVHLLVDDMEHRHLERISLPRPVLIRSGVLGYADSTAVLKDISAVGAYCYTLMPLTNGDVVELFLTLGFQFTGFKELNVCATA